MKLKPGNSVTLKQLHDAIAKNGFTMKRSHIVVENPEVCEGASRFSKVLLWISACLYLAGFFVAFLLSPILAHMDNP